jgi:hypothetical protein
LKDPYVGAIVLFRLGGWDEGSPAVVTRLHDENRTTVDLETFGICGSVYSNVHFSPAIDDSGYSWCWPRDREGRDVEEGANDAPAEAKLTGPAERPVVNINVER